MNTKKDLKAKLENFWYYYKIHMCIALVIIFITAIAINQCAFGNNRDIYVSVVTKEDIPVDLIDFHRAFCDVIDDIDNDGNKIITFQKTKCNPVLKESNDVYSINVIDSQFSGGDVTLFIFDKDNLDFFLTRDAFLNLNDIFDLSLYDNSKIIRKNDGTPIAVSVNGSEKLSEMGIENTDLYCAFIFKRNEYTQKRLKEYDNAKKIVEELLK